MDTACSHHTVVPEPRMRDPSAQTFDVLVVGGGNAGLCAAMTARRAGAAGLLLEASPEAFRGGNSRHTRDIRYLHDRSNDYLTGPYTEDEFWNDLLHVTGGETNEQLARLTIRESAGPRFLARLFRPNGLAVGLAAVAAVAMVTLLVLALEGPSVLFVKHLGEGAFYAVIPFAAMALPASALLLYALGVLLVGFVRFWRSCC